MQPEELNTRPPLDRRQITDAQISAIEEEMKIKQRARFGANCFFWIAALILVDSIITMAGYEWDLIIGTCTTQIYDEIGIELGVRDASFGFSMLLASVFVLLALQPASIAIGAISSA